MLYPDSSSLLRMLSNEGQIFFGQMCAKGIRNLARFLTENTALSDNERCRCFVRLQ